MSKPVVSTVVSTLLNEFFWRLGLRRVADDGDAEIIAYDDDRIVNDMERFDHIKLTAVGADGAKSVFLILRANGKYSQRPELRKLLDGVLSRRGALAELAIVADESLFAKESFVKSVRAIEGEHAALADGHADGRAMPRVTIYPYRRFAMVVPDHKSVPRHRLVPPDELKTLLEGGRFAKSNLPSILESDPPVVWIGGREGQVVEIERNSETAGNEIVYRRIVKR